jgi:hemerythrin-like metal-binding protein
MTPWSPRFETGHAQIDAEHREFFDKLNGLKQAMESGAGRERIVELINLLQRYVLGHFAREESLMHRTCCPAYEENRAAHREFERKLECWLELLSSSNSPVSLLLDVHRESFAWIEAHILNCDCQLRGCRLPDKSQTNSPYPQI